MNRILFLLLLNLSSSLSFALVAQDKMVENQNVLLPPAPCCAEYTSGQYNGSPYDSTCCEEAADSDACYMCFAEYDESIQRNYRDRYDTIQQDHIHIITALLSIALLVILLLANVGTAWVRGRGFLPKKAWIALLITLGIVIILYLLMLNW